MTLNFGKSIFPPAKELNVNYDFQDIASGQGIKEFTLFTTTDINAMSSALVYSRDVYTKASLGDIGVYTKLIDKDFDVTFNLPQRVKGTCILNIDAGSRNTGAAANTQLYYLIVKLRHWDGSTETELDSQTTAVQSHSANNQSNYDMMMECVDLTTDRHFKKGETLRVTIELWGKGASAGTNNDFVITHDPKNRQIAQDGHDFLTDPTVALIQVPFDLKI